MNIKKYFKAKYYREIFDLKNHLFRKEALLKINHKVDTSNRLSPLKKNKLNEIYEILNENDQINKDSMWHSIFGRYHVEFLNYVKNNKNNLKYALDNPRKFNIFYGFDNNVKVFHDNPSFNFKFKYSVSIIDKLISLCESLEILRLDNPEYHKKRYKNLDIEKLISKIEHKINFKLSFKNPFPGEKGIKTSRGIISDREIQAIYQAYKIKKIMDDNKCKIKNVLEFGGGLGRTAYYCYKFGIKNYTLVDLLVPRICQINYLSRLIDDKKVVSKPKIKDFKKKNIKIVSPEFIFSNKIRFDLIFNSDSFTEIDYKNQRRYKEYILRNSKIFFSINHEYNHYKVSDFFKTKNLDQYTRNLYWLKRGYVEEKFKYK